MLLEYYVCCQSVGYLLSDLQIQLLSFWVFQRTFHHSPSYEFLVKLSLFYHPNFKSKKVPYYFWKISEFDYYGELESCFPHYLLHVLSPVSTGWRLIKDTAMSRSRKSRSTAAFQAINSGEITSEGARWAIREGNRDGLRRVCSYYLAPQLLLINSFIYKYRYAADKLTSDVGIDWARDVLNSLQD